MVSMRNKNKYHQILPLIYSSDFAVKHQVKNLKLRMEWQLHSLFNHLKFIEDQNPHILDEMVLKKGHNTVCL